MFELVEESLQNQPPTPGVSPMPAPSQTEGVIYTMPEKFLSQPKSGVNTTMIIGIVVALIVVSGGGLAAVYFLGQKPAPEPVAVQPTPEPAPSGEPTPPPASPETPAGYVAGTPEPTPPAPGEPTPPAGYNAPTPTPPIAPTPPPPPTVGIDSDQDQLTDTEELIYGTDPQKPDTDVDNYLDGSEVRFLFNPNKAAPSPLESSGFVTRYKNTQFNYGLLYPVSWDLRALDEVTNKDVIITAADGETFDVTAEDNASKLDLFTWLTGNSQAVNFNSSTAVPLTFGAWSGLLSQDGTEAYLVQKTSITAAEVFPYVYHLKYTPGPKNELNYLSTFRMMLQSIVAPSPRK